MTLITFVSIEVKCFHLNLRDNFQHPKIYAKIFTCTKFTWLKAKYIGNNW